MHAPAAAAAARAAGGQPSTIHFATGNKKKLEEVVAILAAGQALPFSVAPAALELPELQGEPEEIAAEKCRLAAKELGGPGGLAPLALPVDACRRGGAGGGGARLRAALEIDQGSTGTTRSPPITLSMLASPSWLSLLSACSDGGGHMPVL